MRDFAMQNFVVVDFAVDLRLAVVEQRHLYFLTTDIFGIGIIEMFSFKEFKQ